MLNELLIIERGARQAGVTMTQRHSDVMKPGRVPTLLVRLDEQGHVADVRPVLSLAALWTLRDGKHNSFPFVQRKLPLLAVPTDDVRHETALDRRSSARRDAVLALATGAALNEKAIKGWPGNGLLRRVGERLTQVQSLSGSDSAAVPATFERFLKACDPSGGVTSAGLLREISSRLIVEIGKAATTEWLDIAVAVLIDGKSAFMFDAAGDLSVLDRSVVARVSDALSASTSNEASAGSSEMRCALTGSPSPLVSGNFPCPNLPNLGETYLFARNDEAPTNGRYGRFAAASMPVAQDAVVRLAAAIEALTTNDRKDITWRPIPGEKPKQTDLLVAFVEAAPDQPVTKVLAVDEGDDNDDEPGEEEVALRGNSVAAFHERTQRLIEALRAKAAPLDRTLVRYAVFRKVDPGNRKVSYEGQFAVRDLQRAAEDWVAGERNVPDVSMPVLRKGERKPRPTAPPHVAPLGLITFSRQLFVRGGLDRQEVIGLPAAEALGLFLEPGRKRPARVLRLVLARRTALVAGTVHAMRRSFDAAKEFDRWEVLRTVTALGLLLHKLGRRRSAQEDYMNDAAFRLGQLLAAADIVHAGYCADVRGGDVPPSLLGNQVFAMAQANPLKALDALCRRWKPYEGWVAKAARAIDTKANRRRDEIMRESKNRADSQRGWDITRALSVARRVRPIVEALRPVLTESPTDVFRAELLLGYMAGLPKVSDDGREGDVASAETESKEK